MPVPPPSAPPPPGTTGVVSGNPGPQPQPLGEVVVEGVPERLAHVARMVVLSGMVTNQLEGGALVVRTQVGDLTIRSPTPLPPDKVLTLQIPPGAPPVRAQVFVTGPTLLPAPVLPTAGPVGPASLPPPPGLSISPRTPTSAPSQAVGSALLSLAQTTQPGAYPHALPLLVGSVVQAQVLAAPSFPGLSSSPSTSPLAHPSAHPSAPAPSPPPSVGAPPAPPAPSPSVGAPPTPSLSPDPAPHTSPAAALLSSPLGKDVARQVATRPPPAVLGALLPSSLAELVARLPTAVLLPPSPGAVPLPPALSPALLPALPAQAAFSALPVVLALPPGAQATVQVERIFAHPMPPAATPPSPAGVAPFPAGVGAGVGPSLQHPSHPAGGLSLPGGPSPPPPPPPSISSPLIPTVVIGATPRGEPLLTSPAGLLVLSQHGPLPLGTRVDVSLLDVRDPLPSALAREEGLPPPSPKDWPILQQMATQLPPGVNVPVLRTGTSPHLGGQMLFLLAALGFKDAKGYVGAEAMQTLADTGQTGRLLQLATEMQQVGQSWTRAPEAPLTEWRSLSLPVPPDGAFLRLAVHMREEKSDEGEPESPSTRGAKHLVVEVEMSRLGPLVLDGLIHPKRFDLTLRSQRRLPTPLQDDLRGAFTTALTGMNWTGGLSFHTATDLWMGRA